MPGEDDTDDGKSLLEMLKKKTTHMTEIPKNAKNEGIVRITIVSFFKQAIVGSLWAPSLSTSRLLQHVSDVFSGSTELPKAQKTKIKEG